MTGYWLDNVMPVGVGFFLIVAGLLGVFTVANVIVKWADHFAPREGE